MCTYVDSRILGHLPIGCWTCLLVGILPFAAFSGTLGFFGLIFWPLIDWWWCLSGINILIFLTFLLILKLISRNSLSFVVWWLFCGLSSLCRRVGWLIVEWRLWTQRWLFLSILLWLIFGWRTCILIWNLNLVWCCSTLGSRWCGVSCFRPVFVRRLLLTLVGLVVWIRLVTSFTPSSAWLILNGR